jgi:uncharacterized membrane protein
MPSLLVVASIAFAVALIEADSVASDRWLTRWPRLFGAGPEGARQILSTLAGSMMSVMGITFSMTKIGEPRQISRRESGCRFLVICGT